jgi:ParB family transcriptional regulator, chromosome partitioning protein
MMNKRKEELGKGIRALLRDMDVGESGPAATASALSGVAEIDVNAVSVNPYQPRSEFDAQALEELAASIRVHGLIQPVAVRRLEGGRYQLISGERRLRASRLAGLSRIPAYVRSANDQELLEMGLIENIQRADLNPMEIALHYQRLLDECGLQHDQLAARVGKDRSTVTNYLRILRLQPDIQKALRGGEISLGHAKVLGGLTDPVAQLDLFRRCRDKDMSVRQLEREAVHYRPRKKTAKPAGAAALPPALRQLQDKLSSRLSARVRVVPGRGGQGALSIAYHSEEDLQRLAELLGGEHP